MFKSIVFKFFSSLLAISLLIFFVFGLWINNLMKDTQIERAKNITVDFIQEHVRELLAPQSFVFGSEQSSPERFADFVNAIQAPEIVRIKAWDTESRVVFSDAKSIIGKYFPGDEDLREALNGRVKVTIQKPIKPENIAEKGYGQLLEIYIPVYFEGDSRLAGVVETYYNLDEANAFLSDIRKVIFISMFFIIIGVFTAMWFLFRFLISRRLISIIRAVREIAKGNLETRITIKEHDEIGELAAVFNLMAIKLKESYSGLEQKIRDRTEELQKDNKIMIGRELKMVELKKEIDDLKKRLKNNDGDYKKI